LKTGVNSGAMMLYNLDVLSLRFDQTEYEAWEGEKATLKLQRTGSTDEALHFRVRLFDLSI
jgi:hypothetical protein